MHRPTSFSSTTPVVAATATTVVLAFAVLSWPTTAAESGRSHTLHLTAKRAAQVQFGKAGFTEADKVRTKAGHTVGTAVSDCTPASATKADCTAALAVKGGLIEARFTLSFSNGHIAGKVTGGTMAYQHASGTVAGTSFNGGSHLAVTYHVP
jgi:hypothetical protein